jgi:CBS domain-containing protein
MSKTPAERFIVAYNEIDYSLRTIYGFKRSISFSDMVRKAVTLNSVVRKYEESLIDYGRLRNSIVHKSNPNYIIAEPHEDVVQELEKIAELISTPPTALDRIATRDVLCLSGNSAVREVLEKIHETGFFNIPIYDDNRLMGVANGHDLITELGKQLGNGVNINDYVNNTKIKDAIVDVAVEGKYYKVADRELTIEKALNLFYIDRKLNVIIITPNGGYNERPIGIITTADILDMNAVLENYEVDPVAIENFGGTEGVE